MHLSRRTLREELGLCSCAGSTLRIAEPAGTHIEWNITERPRWALLRSGLVALGANTCQAQPSATANHQPRPQRNLCVPRRRPRVPRRLLGVLQGVPPLLAVLVPVPIQCQEPGARTGEKCQSPPGRRLRWERPILHASRPRAVPCRWR